MTSREHTAGSIPRMALAPILVLALNAGPAATQAPVPAADSAARDTFALPALVVTATRVPLPRAALPTPVTVLTGRDLRARGVATVAGALREVPGAALVRSGGSGAQTSLFLRGGENDYVKVLVDGVPVNDPGGAIDFAGLSTDHVERIEVVRGPVSVLYGSDAMAGVVQVFTRRGAGPPTVAAEVTAGSGQRTPGDDHYAAYALQAGVFGSAGRLSYAVGGGRQASEGVYPLNNQGSDDTGHFRLGWSGTSLDLALTGRVGDGRAHFPTDGAGNIVDENAYLDRRLRTASLEAGWRLGEAVDARLLLGQVTRDQRAVDEQDGPDDDQGVYASILDFLGERRTADARINARFLRSTLTAGIAWERATAETRYASQSAWGPLSSDADFHRTTRGYYVQLLSRPDRRVHLTGGARLDESETYGAFGTYRLGLSVGLAPGTRIRGAVGRGFREPTFAESFGSGFGDIGNPDLAPERSRSTEVGVEQSVGPAVLAITWFDQTFEDLIQYTFSSPVPGEPSYFNVGAARAAGLEVEGRVERGRWSASASYAWLRTEVLDPGLATDATFAQGEPLLRRPTHSGSARGAYDFETGLVSLAIHGVGERDDVDYGAGFPAPRVSLPAHATVDLAAELDLPATSAARLLLRIDNVLGAEYESIAGFPAGGRLLRVGLRLQGR